MKTEPVTIQYEGKPRFIGGRIEYFPSINKTVHVFNNSGAFEPIRPSNFMTRSACKVLSILERLNIVPDVPLIHSWWEAHKASDKARVIKSGGGGC